MLSRRLMRQAHPQPHLILDVSGTIGGYWCADPEFCSTVVGGAVDNFESINGLSAVAGTLKPRLRRTRDTGIYWVDTADVTGGLTVTFSSPLGPDCTVIQASPGGILISKNLVVGSTFKLASYLNFLSGLLIVNRPLTDYEEANIIQYMSRHIPRLGPEIMENPNFTEGLAGYTAGPNTPALSIVSGELIITPTIEISGYSIVRNTGSLLSGFSAPRTFYCEAIGRVGGSGTSRRLRHLSAFNNRFSQYVIVSSNETDQIVRTTVHYTGGYTDNILAYEGVPTGFAVVSKFSTREVF